VNDKIFGLHQMPKRKKGNKNDKGQNMVHQLSTYAVTS